MRAELQQTNEEHEKMKSENEDLLLAFMENAEGEKQEEAEGEVDNHEEGQD